MNVYEECPLYQNDLITMRQTRMDDANQLLFCYSDTTAVPFFNSDNCHGDDFHYSTLQRMQEAIEFWYDSYQNKDFVRWTIVDNASQELIGTVEMFQRIAQDEFNRCGMLRIDLQSAYEKQKYIEAILEIADQDFYSAFRVNTILTKAIPLASERVKALGSSGYRPLNRKFMLYDDYYLKRRI